MNFLRHSILYMFIGLVLLFGRFANSHEIRPAVADIAINGAQPVTISILVNLEALIAEVGAEHTDTDDSASSGKYKQLRSLSSAQLRAEFERFQQKFLQTISIVGADNKQYNLTVQSLVIPTDDDVDIPRDTTMELVFSPHNDETGFTWQWAEEFGEIIVRTKSRTDEAGYAALLLPGQRSELMALSGQPDQPDQAVLQVVWNYLQVGFLHILPKGWDHVLFIIALFLLSPRWKPLLVQVTTFTIAHSITLILGSTGWVNVAAGVVEPLIALSIVIVCLENIFLPGLGIWRVLLVFLFGLLHGLGFASVLAEVGLDNSNFAVALLAFNVGIETGQIAIIIVCFTTFGLWLREKSWYFRAVTVPLSVFIGAIGAYWCYQRVDLSFLSVG